jgi:hypothetical protein
LLEFQIQKVEVDFHEGEDAEIAGGEKRRPF